MCVRLEIHGYYHLHLMRRFLGRKIIKTHVSYWGLAQVEEWGQRGERAVEFVVKETVPLISKLNYTNIENFRLWQFVFYNLAQL